MGIQITGTETELRVAVYGPMDAVSIAQDRDAADRIATATRGRIVLDLSDVSFMDASGLGFLSSVLKRARERNCAVQIQNASGQPLAFLKNLGLDRIVTFALDRAPSAGLPIASNVTEFAKAA